MIGWRDEPTSVLATVSTTAPGHGCEDPELVRHAQHDPAAFTTLFDCFWALVYRYCYSHLRSWAEAEDVAQTAFVKASLALPDFEWRGNGGGFKSWLLRIAHNEAVSAQRSQWRRVTVPFPDEAEAAAMAAMQDPGPETAEIAEAIALNDWLADLVERLPAGQREVIRLRFAGLTTEEIAAALGKRASAVRKTTERATARLIELGRQEGEDWHG